MDSEAETRRRPVHGVFPPNYVTLQRLKEKKEEELQKQEEEKKKKQQEEEDKEKEVQRQKKEEEDKKKKKQEQERRKLQGPTGRPRSSFPPNYVPLQQLKERKEQNLRRDEDGRNKQEEEERNKIWGRSLRPRRNSSGSGNREPLDKGLGKSTGEDSDNNNLRQAADNGCWGTTATGVAEDDRWLGGCWRHQGDRKTFMGSGLRNPTHREKNGEAPSSDGPEDATIGPCVEHRKANIGESATKSPSDSEIPRAKTNGDTDVCNSTSSATGKIARLSSKGELVNAKLVAEEGTLVTAKAVIVTPETTKEENKNEKGKHRKRPSRRKTQKMPQNQAQASDDSANTATVEEEAATVVPATVKIPAGEDRAGDGEKWRAAEKEREGDGSVRHLQKNLARKMVLAASTDGRRSRSWGRGPEKRASLMWVKKGETPL